MCAADSVPLCGEARPSPTHQTVSPRGGRRRTLQNLSSTAPAARHVAQLVGEHLNRPWGDLVTANSTENHVLRSGVIQLGVVTLAHQEQQDQDSGFVAVVAPRTARRLAAEQRSTGSKRFPGLPSSLGSPLWTGQSSSLVHAQTSEVPRLRQRGSRHYRSAGSSLSSAPPDQPPRTLLWPRAARQESRVSGRAS